jgi:hypothetical protein
MDDITHLREILEEREKRYDERAAAQDRAISAAFEAAKEKSQSHNDLIQEMRRKEGTFVTKASLYLALVGVVGLVSATVATLAFFLK